MSDSLRGGVSVCIVVVGAGCIFFAEEAVVVATGPETKRGLSSIH
jgi:hypothetical protein